MVGDRIDHRSRCATDALRQVRVREPPSPRPGRGSEGAEERRACPKPGAPEGLDGHGLAHQVHVDRPRDGRSKREAQRKILLAKRGDHVVSLGVECAAGGVNERGKPREAAVTTADEGASTHGFELDAVDAAQRLRCLGEDRQELAYVGAPERRVDAGLVADDLLHVDASDDRLARGTVDDLHEQAAPLTAREVLVEQGPDVVEDLAACLRRFVGVHRGEGYYARRRNRE